MIPTIDVDVFVKNNPPIEIDSLARNIFIWQRNLTTQALLEVNDSGAIANELASFNCAIQMALLGEKYILN